MNRKQRFILATIPLLLAACTTLGGSGGGSVANLPAVETSAERGVAVDIDLRRDDRSLQVYGEVRNHPSRPGRIPGHIDLTLLDAKGEVVAERIERYHHRSRRSLYSWFLVELDDPDQRAASLRVSHHRGRDGHRPS